MMEGVSNMITSMDEQLENTLSTEGIAKEIQNIFHFGMDNGNMVPEFHHGLDAHQTDQALGIEVQSATDLVNQCSIPFDDGYLINGISEEPYPVQEGNDESGATANEFDRRNKRKIKNRESAARSRARKEAHLKQLEREVQDLREENAKLKKELKVLSKKLVGCELEHEATSYRELSSGTS